MAGPLVQSPVEQANCRLTRAQDGDAGPMTSFTTEIGILDLIKGVLPDGTNGKASWDTVCQWPPDLFAAMAAITERSGLYSEPAFTSYWVGSRFTPTEDWIRETRKIGREWATTGKLPEIVQDCWQELLSRGGTARIDDHGEEAEAWKKTVFRLLAIADEACVGIGFPFSPSDSRRGDLGEPAAAKRDGTTSIQFLVYTDYSVWEERRKTDRKAIGG